MLVPKRVILCFSRVLSFFCSSLFYDSCLIFPLFASLLNDHSTINAEDRDSRSKVLHSKLYGKNILVTVLSPSESLNNQAYHYHDIILILW